LVDIKKITFEQVIKNRFGDAVGNILLNTLQTEIDAGETGHVLKKKLINAIALTDSDDLNLQKQKLGAATGLDGYWVWIVFGIPSSEQE